jgi:translocation and assembly module TamB
MRLVQGLLVSLALLLVILCGALYGLLATPRGLQYAADAAQRLSKGAIKLGSVQGRLLGEFELRDLSYTGADGSQVQLGRLHLLWHPRALWQRRFHAERLDLEQLLVETSPTPAPPAPGSGRLLTQLPVDVAIDALHLSGFELRQPGSGPFKLDELRFAGRWIGKRVEIARLATELPDTGPLALTGAATLAPDQLHIEQLQLKGPGVLEVRGDFGIGDAGSDLQLLFRELRYPFPEKQPPQLTGLNGQGRLQGSMKDYRFELQAEALAQQQPVTLAARGSGRAQQLQFESLALRLGRDGGAGAVSAHGSLAWAPALRIDLDLVLERLNPAVAAAGWDGQLNGQLHTETRMQAGTPDIAFRLQLDRSTLRQQPIELAAQGRTDLKRVQFEQLRLGAGKGRLEARGSAAWNPAPGVDAEALLRQFDPGVFLPGWNGSLNGSLRARTTQTAQGANIAFEAQIGESRLRKHALSLQARGEVQGRTVKLQQLELASDSSLLKASGQATAPFDLAGSFRGPDLSALYPGLGGRLDFDFKLQGPLADPHLSSKGRGSALHYHDTRVAALSWSADLQPSKASRLDLLIDRAWTGLAIPSARLSVAGTEHWHHAELAASTERGDVNAALQGGYDRDRQEWGGQWQAVRLAPAGLPPWALEQPIGLLLGARRFSLEPACFVAASSGGRACFRLEQKVTQPGLQLSASLQAVELAGFRPLLPKGMDLSGHLDGAGDLRWVDDNVAAARAQFTLSAARFVAPDAPPLELQPSTLSIAQQADGRLQASLRLQATQAQLGAELSVAPGSSFVERELAGQLRVTVPDLGFIRPYVRELVSIGGQVDGALQFSGPVGRPRVQGNLTLAGGHAKLATPGIELDPLQLSLSGHGDGPLALDGSAQSGGGTLRLQGTLDPSQAPPRIDVGLSGEDFLAYATPDAHLWITPQLHLVREVAGARLDGTITVPKAQITPRNFGGGNSGVSASKDQILISGGEPQQAPPPSTFKLSSNVRLVLGDAVSFAGFGLSTRIAGAVAVSEQPQREATAQGELNLVEGRYKAYGQELNIETGRLIFSGGPVTKPVVDILASRKPSSEITVGVHVRGTLDQPQLSLQSEPVMSREQQLSWLLLGRPLDQNSSQDRSMISSAAMSLGLSGGDFLAGRIGKSVGLDTFSVGAAPVRGSDVTGDASTISGSQAAQTAGATSTNVTQLTLGKYLTPKLFVSYGVSLFQPGQTFRMLYDLGRGFKVQAESGVASGGDLIYPHESGHQAH